jgi:hypothetical protein
VETPLDIDQALRSEVETASMILKAEPGALVAELLATLGSSTENETPTGEADRTCPEPVDAPQFILTLRGGSTPGVLAPQGHDVYRVQALAGERLGVAMRSLAFDTHIVVRGPDGRVVAANDDWLRVTPSPAAMAGSRDVDSLAEFVAVSTATYTVEARSYQNAGSGSYSIELLTEDEFR